MRIKVLFFASCREISGVTSADVHLGETATTTDLMTELIELYPALSQREGDLKLAVNQAYITTETNLKEGDEVALLPPISGG